MKRQSDDLETRVASRKQQLITQIIEHKKNSSRSGAAEAIDRIKHHLSELSQILKADEWANLSAGTRLRLAEWIAR
jgi:prephenate dehydrogenase